MIVATDNTIPGIAAHLGSVYNLQRTRVVGLVCGDDVVGAEFFLGVEAGDWVFSPPGIRLTLLVP